MESFSQTFLFGVATFSKKRLTLGVNLCTNCSFTDNGQLIILDGKIFLPIKNLISDSTVVQVKNNNFEFRKVTQEAPTLADKRICVRPEMSTGRTARTYGARIGQSPYALFWKALSCAGQIVGAWTRSLATALHRRGLFVGMLKLAVTHRHQYMGKSFVVVRTLNFAQACLNLRCFPLRCLMQTFYVCQVCGITHTAHAIFRGKI